MFSCTRLVQLGSLLCSIAALLPAAASAQSIAGKWKIDGNGYPGVIDIQQAGDGRLSGTMYGQSMVGYFAPGEHTAVLIRSNAQGPFQAYVARVAAGETALDGLFYGLSSASNGADRNMFAFMAVHDTEPDPGPLPDVVLDRAVADMVASGLGINGNTWLGRFDVDQYGPAGEIRGHVYGDVMAGQFAADGTVAFIRYQNAQPYQFYVGKAGSVGTGDFHMAYDFEGEFYALTPDAGASAARMTFDWFTYELVENCGNGVDDDFNGLPDASDPACIRPEVCNGVDDDHNGFVDDLPECHSVILSLDNIDDTASVTYLLYGDPDRERSVCQVASGTYPRSGRCDLSAFAAANFNVSTGTFRVRFANDGGFNSSGRATVIVDGQTLNSVDVPVAIRGLGTFFDRQLQIDFRRGTASWL